MEIFATYKIPVGRASETVVDWLEQHALWLFDYMQVAFDSCLDAILGFLLNPPFVVPVVLLFAGAVAKNYLWRAALVCGLLVLVLVDYRLLRGVHILTVVALVLGTVFAWRGRARWGISMGRLWLAGGAAALAVLGRFWFEPFIPPALCLVAIMAIAGWFMQERWSVVALVICGFLYIINQGYWQDMVEILSLVFWSCILCMGIGIPAAVLAADRPGFQPFLRLVPDLPWIVPVLACLVPALFLFRIGMVPGLVVILVFVLPIPICLTYKGIVSTPKILLEAVEAFGANRWQMLRKVKLPYAWPYIRSSLAQTIMVSLVLTLVLMSVDNNGLGARVWKALQANNVASGFEAGFVIAVIALVLDRLFRPGKEA